MKRGLTVVLLLAALALLWWSALHEPARDAEPRRVQAPHEQVAPASSAPIARAPQAAPALRPKPSATAEAPRATDTEAPAPPDVPTDPRSRAVMRPPIDSGDVAGLRAAFARDAPDPAAAEAQNALANAFTDPSSEPGLLEAVSCRRSICKLDLAWTPERAAAFVNGVIALERSIQSPFAIGRVGEQAADRSQRLELYQQRAP